MKELKFVEKEDLYVGDAFEGTHNYYNYCIYTLIYVYINSVNVRYFNLYARRRKGNDL